MRILSFSLSLFAAILSILSIPNQIANNADEYVDLIELNKFYDQRGRPVFDQVICYERTPTTGRFQVRAWCLVDDRQCLNRRPVKNEETGIYSVDWFDTDKNLQRKITSRLYRESWTQTDPERDDKRVHPEGLRIGLVKRIVEAVE